MKSLLKMSAILVMALCSVVAVDAKSKAEVVTSIFATNIDCESCTKKIMNVLPYQKGVKSVDVKLSNKSVTVKYDSSKSSDKMIIDALKRLDVEAKRVENTPHSCDDHTGHNH